MILWRLSYTRELMEILSQNGVDYSLIVWHLSLLKNIWGQVYNEFDAGKISGANDR